MGSFNAGTWLVGLSIYFIIFFLIVFCAKNGFGSAADDIRIDTSGINPQTASSTIPGQSGSTYGTDSPSMSGITGSVAFMAGFNDDNYDVGVPSEWRWLFSAIFFWLPGFMFVWSLYMAIPFLHG